MDPQSIPTLKILGREIELRRFLFRERRKAERVVLFNTLFIDYHSPVHQTSGTAEGRDISTRGVRFACHEQFPVGTPLDLTLRFAPEYGSDRVVQTRGYVVRCYRKKLQTRYRVACAFDHVEAMHHDQIENFVRWQKDRERNYIYL
jgi:hypothetical protein